MSEWLGGTPEQDEEDPLLFDVEPDWTATWKGMPEFEQKDLTPSSSLLVHFINKADRDAFAKFVQQTLTPSTKSIWFPKAEISRYMDKRFVTKETVQPRYPVYIVSKGRWETRLTSTYLHQMGVKHYIVVEQQELTSYAAAVDTTATLLVLDPQFKMDYDPCDDLGDTKSKGPGAARNFAWAHALSLGATWHWVMDDNIDGFFRFVQNLKTPVVSGVFFRCMEDFVERYQNIGMAGPNYFMFASRKSIAPPFTLNTRIYSCNLIRNDLPYRWRGRYNEDTDLSLRILKDGLCTVQFNAFLQRKMVTQSLSGGCNTDFYSVEGTKPKSEMQVKLHPDCSELVWKFGRWHHHVDYRRFRVNELKLKPGVVIPDGADDYGMTLEILPTTPAQLSAPRAVAPRAAGPSAFSFIQALAARPEPAPARVEKPSPAEEQPAPASPSQPDAASRLRDALLARGHHLLTKDGKFFVSEAGRLTGEDREQIKQHRTELIQLAEEWTCDSGTTIDSGKPSSSSSSLLPSSSINGGLQSSSLFIEDSGRTSQTLTLAEEWTDGVAEQRRDEDYRADHGSNQPTPVTGQEGISDSLQLGIRAGSSNIDSLFADAPQASVTLAQFLGSESRPVIDYTPDEPPDLTGIDEVILNFATDGIDWAKGHRPGGVTIATLDGTLCRFLPFRFAGGNLYESAVKEWARTQLINKKILNARTKFDIHHAREWGIDLEAQGCTFSDIQHTAALLDDHRKRFSLDVLAADYFPNDPFVGRVDESRHLEHHASEVAERERFTARLVGRLRDVMYPEIEKQDLRRVQDLEDAVIPAVVEMEKQGSPIDMALLEQYGVECNAKHDELMWEISREAGFAFEHTPAGWKRLIESLHLSVPDSFSEAVLNEVDHPLVRKGQRASQYASLNSKIFKAYPEHITDGLLRYNINQLASDDGGTVSGRFSIGLVQQVPNADNHEATFGEWGFPRRLFIPGAGDYLEADAAQIEFRLLVHYSENAKLLQAYRDDPWMSFHKQMQSMLLAYKPDMNYAHTKSYNFAAQYGAKSIKLAVMMGFISARVGEEIRKAERWDDPRLKTIKEIEAAYKSAHPEAGALLDRAQHLMKNECDKYCKKGDALHRQYPHRGYIKTYLGRRSRCVHNYKPYIALNRCLQGTGASIMKQKIVELHKVRRETGFVMRITNHDAVLGDATMPETIGKVREVLNAQSFPLKVPILWECGTGRTWADCK